MVPETEMAAAKPRRAVLSRPSREAGRTPSRMICGAEGLRDTHPRGPLDTPSPSVLPPHLLLAKHAPWLRGRVGECGGLAVAGGRGSGAG